MPTLLRASISAHEFNRGLLPPEARRVGTEQFREAVREFYTELFHSVGGTTRVSFEGESIHVSWKQGAGSEDPLEYAVRLLQQSELDRGVSLVEVLLAAEPNDPDILYNLGMAYSDMGRVQGAITLLSRLTEAEPARANGLVALGVAYQRNGDYSEALATLRKAIKVDPQNSYAHRNLGGIIASLGGFNEAESHLREAVRLAPEDQQALYGLAATLEKLGGDNLLQEADELYKRTIAVDPSSYVAEKAREARSRMTHTNFREAAGGEERHDATLYCLDALQRFEMVSSEQVQAITLEIALLGRQGLDTNDPTPKYRLRSLSGDFSVLHLISLMYVGFKRISPEHDIGFDLSDEYAAAQRLFSQQRED